MEFPEEFLYTEDHEWVLVEDDIVTVGISDFAQDSLGDIVFVELPGVGDVLEKGQTFGTVEAVKTVEDLYSPVSGEIVEVNDTLEESAEQVNSDPYNDGWMIKVRIDNSGELDELLTPEGYREFVDGA